MIRKSLLFVPAKVKMLSKIGTLGADSYIVDLEDSIEPEGKQQALQDVKETLKAIDCSRIHIIVRLNKPLHLLELKQLESFQIDFMLPKFEIAEEYQAISEYSATHHFYALIETPLGILNAAEIASLKFITGIAFGAEDYTASIGMVNDPHLLIYQKSRLVNCAKAHGKIVYDTPSFQLSDQMAFENEVMLAVKLGFDGKMAIHPKHVTYINDAFGAMDNENLREIIATYESAQKAVLVYKGKPYERMHIEHMKKVLREKG